MGGSTANAPYFCADEADLQLAATSDPTPDDPTQAYELALHNGEGGRSKLLGHREFARFYKQRHRPSDARASVAANAVLSK